MLPHAAPGIVSGALLAVARAAGETAPLLFTIGATQTANWKLFDGPNTALSVQIFGNATSPFIPAQERAYGAALTLILIVFVATTLARIVTVVYTRRTSCPASMTTEPDMTSTLTPDTTMRRRGAPCRLPRSSSRPRTATRPPSVSERWCSA